MCGNERKKGPVWNIGKVTCSIKRFNFVQKIKYLKMMNMNNKKKTIGHDTTKRQFCKKSN